MKCGHCGTEANEGYTVCTGCGANRRSSKITVAIGGVIAFSSFAFTNKFMNEIIRFRDGGLFVFIFVMFAGVCAMLLGLWLIKRGLTQRWYREIL